MGVEFQETSFKQENWKYETMKYTITNIVRSRDFLFFKPLIKTSHVQLTTVFAFTVACTNCLMSRTDTQIDNMIPIYNGLKLIIL